jgi:hypothetical protein
MLDPDSLVGGDALAQFALILAVPVRAHRNREFRLRPVAAQAFEDRRGLFGRQLGCRASRCLRTVRWYASSERGP